MIKELSEIGRIAAFKIVIFHKLLYLFRTIPIPHTFFIKLQAALTKFIWKGTKPWVALSIMINTPSVPWLYQYYLALLLCQSHYWWKNDTNKTRSPLEAESLLVPSTKAILLATLAGHKTLESPLPSIQASFQVIHACSNDLCSGKANQNIHLPIQCLQIHIPHLNLSSWERAGIHHLKDLLEDNSFPPFSVLNANIISPPLNTTDTSNFTTSSKKTLLPLEIAFLNQWLHSMREKPHT